VRIFLSFNSKDVALAEAIRAGLSRLEPETKIFFSPVSLGSGLWVPKLADEIAAAEAFLVLIGPHGIGPWQKVEYFAAFDRHLNEKGFALVPVIAAGAQAPGLSFLRSLNWVEAPVVTDDKALHQMLAALQGETATTTTPLWKLVHPYRGLEAMTEVNADYFFGRRTETSGVLNTLAGKPDHLPILVGASGVGKSSIALAGVLSALRAMRWPSNDGAGSAPWPSSLQNSRSWLSLTMRPGNTPLEALAAIFIGLWGLDAKDPDAAALPRKWAKGLSTGDNKLADLIDTTQEELKKREGATLERVLLYLDQGEELYARAAQSEARRFSEVLAEGLGDDRLFAFASLRADYFDRFQADEALFKVHQHINVAPLNREQLEGVVTEPARVLGVTFEDNKIAHTITNAAAAEPGALPLLSYLLTDMWADMIKRDKPVLGLPAQAVDIGGVLANRANMFLKENPNDEKALRRLLTLKLAIVPADGEPVRRQTHREECSDAEWSLATRLADYPYRLVVMGEREADGRIVAEVAHEALLRAWPLLAQWLREERDFLILKGEAERAERRWRGMGQADRALLTGLDLARAKEWLPNRQEDMSAEVIAYVQRSVAYDRTARERQLKFQRRVTLGAIAAALLMAVVGVFAGRQWKDAATERDRAIAAENRVAAERDRADTKLAEAQTTQSRFLADLSRQRRAAGDAAAALLLALEGLPDETAGIARRYVPEEERALNLAWFALRERFILLGHDKTVYSAAFSPDGKRIVTASADKTARLWDAETGKQIGAPLVGHEDVVKSAAFSPDGKRIVTASADKTARLWDAETGKQIGAPLAGHDRTVYSAAFSPDGKRIVTASGDHTARLWDAGTGKQIGAPLMGHEADVYSAAFSPDGMRIVTASADKTARLWDAETCKQIGASMVGHEADVWSAAFSPDGKRIVTASADKTARMWDAETGKQISAPLVGHEKSVDSAAFSPDGKRVVTASLDQTARLWDVETGKQIGAPLVGHENRVVSAAFSPDGKHIATASLDETARLWDVETGKQIGAPLVGHENSVVSAAFSPDGKHIATASLDQTARLWDAGTGKQIGAPLVGHGSALVRAAFSPDGKRVVTASLDRTARLWDAGTGKQIGVRMVGHEGWVMSAAFSPDGKRIVTASADKTARMWDAETGKQIGAPLVGHEGWVMSAAFSPDGKRVVTASLDRTARLWHVETGKQIGAPLAGHDRTVYSAAFSPDGKRIVTASSDQTARLWDTETGKQIAAPLVDDYGGNVFAGQVFSATFNADGNRIVTASEDKTAKLWDVFATTQQLVSAAKAVIPRCLTVEQRTTFFLLAEPPAWCIEMEKWPYQTAEWKQWLVDTRAGKNPPLPSPQ
jgi:WD40 repeat protein